MKSIMALGLSFAVVLAGVVFALVLAGRREVEVKQPTSIFERDFSAVIAKAKTYDNPFDLNWEHANSNHGLTKPQDMQINGWQAPNGEYPQIDHLFFMYQSFERTNGRPPKDGAELFMSLLSSQNMSPTGLEGLPATKLPGGTFLFINPQTGRFYGSFDGLSHEPGGLEIHKITNPDDALRAFRGRPGGEGFEKGDIGYELIIKGSDGKSRLDTACIKLSKTGPPGGSLAGKVLHRGEPVGMPEG